jgi:hypothetical protein
MSDKPVARPLPTHRAAQTQNKRIHIPNIHALNGIRTYDPSVRGSKDSSCLRRRGYCDRQPIYIHNSFTIMRTKHVTVSYLCNASVTHDSSSEPASGFQNEIMQGNNWYKLFTRINLKLKENKPKLKRLVRIYSRSTRNSFIKIDPVSWTMLLADKWTERLLLLVYSWNVKKFME